MLDHDSRFSMDAQCTSVEVLLQPLFEKLSILSSQSLRRSKRSPRSKNQDVIISSIIEVLYEINQSCLVMCEESPVLSGAISTALDDVTNTGQLFQNTVQSFTSDPTNSNYCESLHDSGTAFLSALTRLLILAKLSDKSNLTHLIAKVLNSVEEVLSSTSSKKLSRSGERFLANTARLISLLSRKSDEICQVDLQEQSAVLQHTLRHNTKLLLTSSKVYLNHPDDLAAQDLKDSVAKAICDSLTDFQSALDGSQKIEDTAQTSPGRLLNEFHEFENNALLSRTGLLDNASSSSLHEALQTQVDNLLQSAYRISDSPATDDAQRSAIHDRCNQLKHATAQLLAETRLANRAQMSDAMQNILRITGALRDQLQRTAVSHAIQRLVLDEQPLMSMCDATKFGNEQVMDKSVRQFQAHTRGLVDSAHELVILNSNEDPSKRLLLASTQLQNLSHHLVKAARLLFERPNSKSIETNYETFRNAYQEAAVVLTSSLKEVISIHDFLTVADNHMCSDYDLSLTAITNKDDGLLQQASTTMQHRASLVCSTVPSKMGPLFANREYVDHVMNSVILLRDEHTPNFVAAARDTVSRLAAHQAINEVAYREAGENMCNALHGLRMTALNEAGLPSELQALQTDINHLEEVVNPPEDNAVNELSKRRRSSHRSSTEEPRRRSSATIDRYDSSQRGSQPSLVPAVSRQENRHSEIAEIYAKLTGPEQENLDQELAGFLLEKTRLVNEVGKWDDSSNDIIVLAKKMCLIMMDMTEFTRGNGPFQSIADVIQAAREISELGRRLDELCCQVAEFCPDSSSRRDLLAYLQRVTLHCHQLDITCRVKAGMSKSRTEQVESATTLIQTARNLMNAVVLTVKESYLASTKYHPNSQRALNVRWKMAAPTKKALTHDGSTSNSDDDDDPTDWRRPAGTREEEPGRTTSGHGGVQKRSSRYRSQRPRQHDALHELSKFDNL